MWNSCKLTRFLRMLALWGAGFLLAPSSRAELWCTGYYPGWEQGGMPAAAIDFATVTHVVHFALGPNSNGTLNSSANSITLANSTDVLATAHAAGRKVLICIGGADSQAGFQGATSGANLGAFITNIVNFLSTRGYDGVDVDWEPLDPGDSAQYANFITGLHATLGAINPRPLLTAAIAAPPTPPTLLATLQTNFDQINLMTYDLSGPYAGWVTWFNAPLYDGGYRFPSTGQLVPSAEGMIASLINAGVPARKLGLGIAFYGWIWSGGAGTSTGGAALPRQGWTTAPVTTQLSYNSILATYYQSNLYHWDTNAQAAYLSLDNAGSTNDKFISYDDPRTCQSKISYARNRGLGGVFIWELAQDHKAGQSDPLLLAIRQALATPRFSSALRSNQDFQFSFTTSPLAFYRILATTNPVTGGWNTVTSGIPGSGDVYQFTDSGVFPIYSQLFYRIQTPP